MFYKFVKYITVAFLLAMCVATCAKAEDGIFEAHGSWWFKDYSLPICESVKWVKVPLSEVDNYCESKGVRGCADFQHCRVFSIYSEKEAKDVCKREWGLSHYEHEAVWHLQKQLRHPWWIPQIGRSCWPW